MRVGGQGVCGSTLRYQFAFPGRQKALEDPSARVSAAVLFVCCKERISPVKTGHPGALTTLLAMDRAHAELDFPS